MRSIFWLYICISLLLHGSLKAEPSRAQAKATDDGVSGVAAGVANMPRFATEHFSVACEDVNGIYAERVGRVLEAAYKQFSSAFGQMGLDIHLPQEKLAWICFRETDSFREYSLESDRMDLSFMSGYYSSRTNRVAILEGGSRLARRSALAQEANYEPVLQSHPLVSNALDADEYTEVTRITHELGHQLAFNCGLQKRRVMYPIWVSEGVAATFEEILYSAQYLGGRNSVRLGTLTRMRRQNRLIELGEFVPMTRVFAEEQTEGEVYAQSWGLFYFLSQERKSDLKGYLEKLASCAPGRRSQETLTGEFTGSFGPVSALEGSWNAFLDNLVRQPEDGAETVAADAATVSAQ